MASHGNSATFSLGSRQVKRLGYGQCNWQDLVYLARREIVTSR
ncbi:putative oxidoreductase [Citrobacter koseri]|uniref:Putative oxidoreductase n=1 Tax=Citrobacter koseri TaxID=545 RepID=A0A3S4IS44_CITKO|nr:putative oxidoreductase [Citrobacter koseri]